MLSLGKRMRRTAVGTRESVETRAIHPTCCFSPDRWGLLGLSKLTASNNSTTCLRVHSLSNTLLPGDILAQNYK